MALGHFLITIFCVFKNSHFVVISEGPALKTKPSPPRLASEEEKADPEAEEQELVTVTKVVEEVRKFGSTSSSVCVHLLAVVLACIASLDGKGSSLISHF